jgi:hypothetical protein
MGVYYQTAKLDLPRSRIYNENIHVKLRGRLYSATLRSEDMYLALLEAGVRAGDPHTTGTSAVAAVPKTSHNLSAPIIPSPPGSARLQDEPDTLCGRCGKSRVANDGYSDPRGGGYCDDCTWQLAENGEFNG